MSKITSFEELNKLKESLQATIAPRLKKGGKIQINICSGSGCLSSGSKKAKEIFEKKIKENNLEEKIEVIITGCFGFCGQGPIVNIYPEDVFYVKVDEKSAHEIFDKHIIGGNHIVKNLYVNPDNNKPADKHYDLDFYRKQKRVALRHCGLINPESIDDYIAFGGYEALGKILKNRTKPEEIIAVLKESGIRGRGGAGFPTSMKWEFAKNAEGNEKYVICNADEGDPGAFMDRSILEGDPHSVIEAMAIAAYTIGSKEGYVYIRAEYPTAVERLYKAISDGEEKGLIGNNILNSGFSFKLNVCLGAGAFVCGEETALIASIEGKRGMPNAKPPFPAIKGLWGKPTLINNVETFTNIPEILLKGGKYFKDLGTGDSAGTKVFALGGDINTGGLVEVPMGITLREIIFEIGGGIPGGRDFKAVQTGGPSGGCIPASALDTPIDFEELAKLGSIIGSGGMIVMDDQTCMVDISRFFLDFSVDESCGKCTPCREGTKRMLEILEKITEGKGELEDLDKLENLATVMQTTSLCGLGQTAANPVLSTLKYFRDEYIEHVVNKKCRAGICKELLEYYITDKCIGCTKCARNCPVTCITGSPKSKHLIDTDACIKCGTCMEVCPVDAIIKQ